MAHSKSQLRICIDAQLVAIGYVISFLVGKVRPLHDHLARSDVVKETPTIQQLQI